MASVEECAERLLYMLRNPKESAEIALSGKEIVRERFLLTRLIADELELYASLLGGADGGALRRLTDLSTDI